MSTFTKEERNLIAKARGTICNFARDFSGVEFDTMKLSESYYRYYTEEEVAQRTFLLHDMFIYDGEQNIVMDFFNEWGEKMFDVPFLVRWNEKGEISEIRPDCLSGRWNNRWYKVKNYFTFE